MLYPHMMGQNLCMVGCVHVTEGTSLSWRVHVCVHVLCCGSGYCGVSVYIKQQAHASQSTLLHHNEALCVASRIWFRVLSVLCRVCGCCGKASVAVTFPDVLGLTLFTLAILLSITWLITLTTETVPVCQALY